MPLSNMALALELRISHANSHMERQRYVFLRIVELDKIERRRNELRLT